MSHLWSINLMLIIIGNVLTKEIQYVCQYISPHFHPNVNFIKKLEKNLVGSKVYEINEKSNLKNPMRISYIYDSSFQNHKNSDYFKLDILENIRQLLAKSIGVKYRTNDPLRVPYNCNSYKTVGNGSVCVSCENLVCNGFVTPKKLYDTCSYFSEDDNAMKEIPAGPGLTNTDLLIQINMKDIIDFSSVQMCTLGIKYRPILATITISTKAMDEFHLSHPNLFVTNILHDINHILAFSFNLFKYFIDKDGKPLVNETEDVYTSGIIKKINRSRKSVVDSYQKTFLSFIRTKTLNTAREYFNCNILDGVDMEDEEGYQPSHFDELVYSKNLMSPVIAYPQTLFNKLTLSFLEDTGWYYINYNKAEPVNWGHNLGCDFATKGCYTYMKNNTKNSIHPFCNQAGALHYCSDDRTYFGVCSLTKHDEIQSTYLYFTKLDGVLTSQVKYYTGSNILMENCPLLIAEVEYNVTSVCTNRYNHGKLSKHFLNSYYGEDSRCLNNKITPQPNLFFGAACFQFRILNITHFYIRYANQWYICQFKSQIVIYIINYRIEIDCGEVWDSFMYKNDTRDKSLLNNSSAKIISTLLILLIFFSKISEKITSVIF